MRWSALALLVASTAFGQPKLPVDRYGDPLPPGAIGRLGTVRFRLGGSPQAFAVTPDAKRVLTVDHTTAVTSFDATTGRRLGTTPKHKDNSSYALALSPDCTRLASADHNGMIRVINATNGNEIRKFKAAQNGMNYLTFSSDGTLIAGAGYEHTVRIWAADTGEMRHEFPKTNNMTRILAFRPDGKMLAAVGDDNTVHLWSVPPGSDSRQFQNKEQVRSIAFSRDGSLLAIVVEKSVLLWDPNTGASRGELKGHDKPVASIAFLPDGKSLMSGSDDGTLRLWEVATAKETKRIDGLRGLQTLLLTRDGRTAFVLTGHAIRSFDVASGKELHHADGHEADVYGIAFTPDGKSLVTGGSDCRTLVWDIAAAKERQRHAPHEEYIFAIAVSPDGKTMASAGGKPFLRLQPLTADGDKPPEIKGLHVYCFCVAFSPDGIQIATGDREKEIHIFDVKSGKQVVRLRNRELEVYTIAFSPDGRTLASAGSAKTVFLWNILGGSPRQMEEQQDSIRGLAFSPDGRTLAATADGNTIRLYDAIAGQLRQTLKGHTDGVNRLVFSPDGRLLASAANDHTVRLWDVATGREMRKFDGHGGAAYCVAFSPDGRRLASGSSDTTVLFWDVSDLPAGPRPPAAKATAEERTKHWAALVDSDAAAAFKAIVALAGDPDGTVPFLAEHLKSAPKLDPAKVERLLGELGNGKFTVRDKATRELAKLGEEALPALLKFLETQPPTEARRRVEKLIENVVIVPPPETLRILRAIEALEMIGTPTARKVLQTLATGEPASRITRDAKQSLQRLERK